MALAAPKVELNIGGTWTDISQWVYYRDLITIQRGRPNEASALNPSTCAFTLDNRDGRFSPRNPLGPYYGLIGRNTQCRVSVVRDGVQRYRFYGEISSWPVAWDMSGKDVYVQVDGSGLTRRLGQGNAPLSSPLFRELTNPGRSNIVAYWSLEDPSGATSCASGRGDKAMTFNGTPTLAGDSTWPGSDPIATMGTGVFTGTVPAYAVTGKTSTRVYATIPAGAVASTMPLFQIVTDGTARRFQVKVGAGGQVGLIVYGADGDVINDFGTLGFSADGGIHSVVLELTQSGADVTCKLIVEHFNGANNFAVSPPNASIGFTVTGQTVGMVKRLELNSAGTLGTVAIGHATVANDLAAFANTGAAAIGWIGESAGLRIPRIAQEQKIPFQLLSLGRTGNETTLGPQLSSAFLDLVTEAVATDLGMLIETRDSLGLAYRTRLSLYNQAPGLALDYAANQLADPLAPIDDDQSIVNDMTVSRIGGSSAKAERTTGPISTLDPPNGVGRYENSVSVTLASDRQLPNQAGWRLALGTVDETRYPTLSIDLTSDVFTKSATLTANALVLDLGDRITVANLPSWLPPNGISQIVQGYKEVLGLFEHTLDFNCSPESPYRVAYTDDTSYGWVDTDGSSLATALSATDTLVAVSANAGTSALWTDDPTDTPFDIAVGGEIMTVHTVGSVLNGNPTFETNTTGWTGVSGTLVRSSAQAKRGSWSGLFTVTTGSSPRAESAQVAVTAGAQYRAVGWLFTPAAVPTTVGINVNWSDVNHAYLSTSAYGRVPVLGVWELYDSVATAPAGAAFASVMFIIGGTPATGVQLYGDDVRIFPVSSYLTSPQTMTVYRSVNGVVKAQLAGADVRLAHPAIVGL